MDIFVFMPYLFSAVEVFNSDSYIFVTSVMWIPWNLGEAFEVCLLILSHRDEMGMCLVVAMFVSARRAQTKTTWLTTDVHGPNVTPAGGESY